MNSTTEIVTIIFSLGAIIADVIIVMFFIAVILQRHTTGVLRSIILYSYRHAVILIFIISLGSILGSLFYSTVAGFEACELCWWQRVLMYPQALISAVVLWKHGRRRSVSEDVFDFSLILSIVGAAVAAYNYYGQSINPAALPACSATGVSCTKIFFVEFGYVTLPMMSLTAFLLIIVIVAVRKIGLRHAQSAR